MGLLKGGQWVDQWYDTQASGGEFKRQDSRFRNWITTGGESGPNGQSGFQAESGRYHLFVSLACPWAHRTLIFRQLKELVEHVSVTVLNPFMLTNGWEFDSGRGDLYNLKFLYELYLLADPEYEGRVTVPVLWDKQQKTIINNESSEIIRIFNNGFDRITGNSLDFYPEYLRPGIDKINEYVYHRVNNGVYKAGFATTQSAYESACRELFETLDWLDGHLGKNHYLVGNQLTEADWRLFTTLIRFDAVYHGHFKCNLRKLSEYRHIPFYLQRLYTVPGVAETVNFDHIKSHYYGSHKTINPTGIIPVGPDSILPA